MAKRTITEINLAQKRATTKAIALNKAMKLPYYVVVDDKIYEVTPDGKKKFIKKALFGTIKVKERHIKLDHGH